MAIAVVVATVAVVAGVGWFLGRDDPPAIPALPAGSDTAGDSIDGRSVNGTEPTDEPGTCYFSADTALPSEDETLSLNKVDCAQDHNYELVSLQTASQTEDGTYPGPAYWDGPVTDTCRESMATYTGRQTSTWPSAWSVTSFFPEPESWADGYRQVACMAFSSDLLTESIRAA